MKTRLLLLLIVCAQILSTHAFAMKSRTRIFSQNCDLVWKAAVAVAKTEQYRIVSISKEEQIISLAAGGFWGGERILSLTLSDRGGDGCSVSVQSRFSGLVHSDGPDLLRRIYVELVGNSVDRNSKAFVRFKACMEGPGIGDDQCEERFRKDMNQDRVRDRKDSKQESSKDSADRGWWNTTKPDPSK